MKSVIKLENIKKNYRVKNTPVNVLSKINVEFEYGKFYLIIGHSGSGKTTLINIIGLLLNYDEGKYFLQDKLITDYDEKDLCVLRSKKIGYIFQNFNLSQNLKAYENVMLPMLINKDIKKEERFTICKKLLESVGLEDRMKFYPKQLSGGECQRLAIARALANDPGILIADEPTGNLDVDSEKNVFEILKKLSKEGKCVIVVSHSKDAKKYADVIYNLEDGQLIKEK